MVEENGAPIEETSADERVSRIYEAGYHILPTVAEDQVEKVVGEIRSLIERSGGSFIAEGAPVLTKLAYDMEIRVGDAYQSHDRGYFGWLKFEASVDVARSLDEALKTNTSILRHIVFKTVREETRARMKAPTLREVKRTDTIKSTVRREEAAAAPVSEADLEKALQDITEE